ncbi:MAG: hypothetical protein ABH877_01040 [bacterium]
MRRIRCPVCAGELVRCVIEWEDGSASVLWRCECDVTDDDREALRRGPVASLAGAVVLMDDPVEDET